MKKIAQPSRTRRSRHTSNSLALLLAASFGLVGCDQGEPEFAQKRLSAPPPAGDASAVPSAPSTSGTDTSDDAPTADSLERELVAAQGSRSTLGRTRDNALDSRNQMQGGQETGPRAIVASDEQYAEAGPFRWDLADEWAITIPQDPNIVFEAEVPSAFGSGRIIWLSTEGTPDSVIRQFATTMYDSMGGDVDIDRSTEQVGPYPVTRARMDGTYTGDQQERPFYSIQIAAADAGNGNVAAAVFIAAEQVVDENAARWDEMLASMTAR